MRVAALVLVLLSLGGASLCSAASADENPEARAIKLADPMYVKFQQLEQGDFVTMEGRVGAIQQSHSSYSQNTFFVKSVKDDTKVLVTSPEDVKVSIREGACVRVKGWVDVSQALPSIRLPTADATGSAVLCTDQVDWWTD